jgi:hypothetical protein
MADDRTRLIQNLNDVLSDVKDLQYEISGEFPSNGKPYFLWTNRDLVEKIKKDLWTVLRARETLNEALSELEDSVKQLKEKEEKECK